MATKPKLDVDLSGTPIDQTRYQIMIESLMYLTSSTPDIVVTPPNSLQRKTRFGIVTSWREEDLIREIDLYMPL
ncbi:hypothetical protein Tco_0416595, partial [Tanacetum coccineum]